MSRAKPRRGAAVADRLSEALQDDLADVASTMDWIDAAPPEVKPPPGEADSAASAEPGSGPVPATDTGLDLMLDDFALAVDAMFSARDKVLASQPGAAGVQPLPDRESDQPAPGDRGA